MYSFVVYIVIDCKEMEAHWRVGLSLVVVFNMWPVLQQADVGKHDTREEVPLMAGYGNNPPLTLFTFLEKIIPISLYTFLPSFTKIRLIIGLIGSIQWYIPTHLLCI